MMANLRNNEQEYNMSSKKNVIIITTDQHRFDCIAVNGNRVVQTPNIDRLATMGVSFENNYCSAPVCSPARASILTGRHARSHGLFALGYRMPDDQIPKTLPVLFEAEGYDTGIMGKVHLEALEAKEAEHLDYTQPYFGFRKFHVTEDDPRGEYLEWIRTEHPKYYDDAVSNVSRSFAPAPYVHADGSSPLDELYVSPLPEELHQTPWITQKALDFIDEEVAQNRNFFAWFSYVDPHHPWNPPASYADLYDYRDIPLLDIKQNDPAVADYAYSYIPQMKPEDFQKMIASYYALITFTDAYIGKILDHLEEKGLLENTLIVFTSDHGDYNADHGLVRKCWRMYEGIIHTPLIVVDPDSPCKGTRISGYTQDIDIMPTVLDLCRIPYHGKLDGFSLAEIIRGTASDTERQYAVTEFTMNDHPFGDNQWSVCLMQDNYKLHYYPFEDKFYLYDLKNDCEELHDLADNSRYAPELAKLKDTLLRWETTTEFYMRPQKYRW